MKFTHLNEHPNIHYVLQATLSRTAALLDPRRWRRAAVHGHAPQKSGQSSLTASSGSCSNSIASNVCGMGEKGSCGPGGESVCGSTSSTGAIGSIGEGRGADSGSSNFNSGAASYTGSGACSDQVDGDGCLRSPLPATSPVTVVISTLAPVNSGTARGHLPAVSSQLVARNRQVIFFSEHCTLV